MDQMAERLIKLREERIAREKARIAKLRELNLKKYNKSEEPLKNSMNNLSTINKSTKSEINVKANKPSNPVKNNFHVNSGWNRPISAPITNSAASGAKAIAKPKTVAITSKTTAKNAPNHSKFNATKLGINKMPTNVENKKPDVNTDTQITLNGHKESTITDCNHTENVKSEENLVKKTTETKPNVVNVKPVNHDKKPLKVILNKSANLRKSLAVPEKTAQPTRKSMFVKPAPKDLNCQESVFDRLYKPKSVQKMQASNIEKLHNDPNYLKKVIRTTGLILNKRHTVFDVKPKTDVPVRRSISAVHFKRISKQEMSNCIHKWASIGDKLDNVHLKHINEDENVKQDKVISAVKSERKKVKFLTPISNFNTPRPEELQSRLQAWLQKRGKNMDSYHHLQCFGIHHLPQRINFEMKYDEENKENIAVESDSDDESYTENMNEEVSTGMEKWRTASLHSESEFNDTQNTTLTCSDAPNIDDILLGALNDLTELLREGFDWEQCARWLRAIRDRFPSAPHTAAYWECRAALEETRGDLPASVQCWEEAIAKGTERSVVEANLDQLLDKFMQLKISPNSGARKRVNPKLVDVKNVFKSTIIRFAVQQAKLRQSDQMPTPKFTVTPVRRSHRLSCRRTPLQAYPSLRHAKGGLCGEAVFVPNNNLCQTP